MRHFLFFLGIVLCAVLISGCIQGTAPSESRISAVTITPTSTLMTQSPKPSVTVSKTVPVQTSLCAAFVEGTYTTRVVEGGNTYATFQTIGNGKAILTLSTAKGVDTYKVTYNPKPGLNPCEGIYGWQGFLGTHPYTGSFFVIGRNPDQIAVYNDAAGNFDALEMVRI